MLGESSTVSGGAVIGRGCVVTSGHAVPAGARVTLCAPAVRPSDESSEETEAPQPRRGRAAVMLDDDSEGEEPTGLQVRLSSILSSLCLPQALVMHSLEHVASLRLLVDSVLRSCGRLASQASTDAVFVCHDNLRTATGGAAGARWRARRCVQHV
jgi:hypothetical protein